MSLLRSISRLSLLLAYLGGCTLDVGGAGPEQSLNPTPITGPNRGLDPGSAPPGPGQEPNESAAGLDAGGPIVPVEPAVQDAGTGGAFGPDQGSDAEADAMAALDAGATALTLTSSAFSAGGRLPDEHGCLGRGSSPPLAWNAGPPGTQSYAVALFVYTESIVTLPRATNWVVWDVHALALPQGMSAGAQPSSVQGARQASRVTSASGFLETPRYQPPCAILGSQHYELVLYALNVATLSIDTPSSPDEVVTLIESSGVRLASSTLPFTFP